jgi:hypothetical protein
MLALNRTMMNRQQGWAHDREDGTINSSDANIISLSSTHIQLSLHSRTSHKATHARCWTLDHI